jgi:VWFA-related protein
VSRTLLALVCACTGHFAAFQERPPSQPPQPFTATTNAVVIDVVVRDGKGNPVIDLGKEDFQLFEDGIQQQVGDVTAVRSPRLEPDVQARTGTPSAQTAEPLVSVAPRTSPTFLALVFDRLSLDAQSLAYNAALASVDRLAENGFVAVYSSDLTLRTIQTYTNDREELRRALKQIATRTSSRFDRSAMSDDLKDRDDRGTPLAGDADPSVPWVASPESIGRPVDIRGIGAREIAAVMQAAAQSSWEALAREQQGYATTNALLAVTSALGLLPGRKSVVFFAESLAIPEAVRPHFSDIVATANRGNVTVYTMDAAGLRVHSKDAETGRAVTAMGRAVLSGTASLAMLELNEDALRKDPRTSLTLLAKSTGGFLVDNTNDLTKGLERIDADRRFYYLLTYVPKNTAFDGRWRGVVVRVPDRKVDVRARTGYLAVRSASTLPLLAYEAPALAALERSPAPTDLAIRGAALVFPAPTGNRTAVLAATSASALRFEADEETHKYKTDFSILARIVDARGRVVRKSSQPYRLTGAVSELDRARRGDILFFRQPTLAPGQYTLEVAVHDALASRSGVLRTAFTVPDASLNGLQVSSLVLVDRAERVKPEDRAKDNPLYAGDVLVYPNLGEPLRKSRDKALTFYVVVVPSSSGPPPEATLQIAREGRMLAEAPLALAAPDVSAQIRHIAQIPLERFEAGSYTLRLTVVQGDRREERATAFQLRD